jgi:hypothetical protein
MNRTCAGGSGSAPPSRFTERELAEQGAFPARGILVSVALERLRGRMPLLAFVLLAVPCLVLIGFGCACLDDQFAQVLDRVAQAVPPALIVLWPGLAMGTLASLALVVVSVPARGRASPADLQRFLF